MSVTLIEALVKQKGKKNRVKLTSGEKLEGEIISVNDLIIKIQMPDKGAGSPIYTVPLTSILYVSDCELT